LFAPDALIRELDERLRAALHGERRRDADMAYDDGLEIAIACLDCKTGETRIATAGPPVHHIDAATGQSVRCRTRRYGVGFHQVNDEAITQTRTNLQSGDALLLYTDGLVEQVGGDRGIMLGRKRVIETAQSVHMQPASAVRDRLMEAYDAWRGERAPRDDLTLMVLKYGGRHAS
jgi:serine phosphatase RsbU (regulator of sigma subunit)